MGTSIIALCSADLSKPSSEEVVSEDTVKSLSLLLRGRSTTCSLCSFSMVKLRLGKVGI